MSKLKEQLKNMGEKRVQQELKVLRKNNEKLKIDCNAHIVDNQSLKGTVLARKFKKVHVQEKLCQKWNESISRNFSLWYKFPLSETQFYGNNSWNGFMY